MRRQCLQCQQRIGVQNKIMLRKFLNCKMRRNHKTQHPGISGMANVSRAVAAALQGKKSDSVGEVILRLS